MDVIRFEGGRMKITLTKEDLALYEIDLERAKRDDTTMKSAFDAILDIARKRTGETPEEEDARCVQIYPSRDGGCEIFVQRNCALTPLPGLPGPGGVHIGRYLCRFEREPDARGVYEGLMKTGERVQIWRARDRDCWYLVSSASRESLRFLEAFGRKCAFDPSAYLREHLNAELSDRADENRAPESGFRPPVNRNGKNDEF